MLLHHGSHERRIVSEAEHALVVLQLKDVESFEPGQQLDPNEIFKVGEMVDVAGTTVGKGFQGETYFLHLPHRCT